MRLHITDLCTRGGGETLERSDLVDDVGGKIGGRDVHVASPEAREVRIGDMRTDRDAALGGGLHGAQDADRIAGVEPAGDIGARDDLEHRRVIAHAPCAVALAEVAVEIDRVHAHPPSSAKIGPIDLYPMYQVSAQTSTPRPSSQRG